MHLTCCNIISRIGKHVRHITLARSWLGCLLGILIPSVVFYLYLLLNGNYALIIDFSLEQMRILDTLFPVPSAEIGKGSRIEGKWRSLGTERSSLRMGSFERSQLRNNFEVCCVKFSLDSVRYYVYNDVHTSDVPCFQGEMRHGTRSDGLRTIQFNLCSRNCSEVHSVLSHESVAFSFARRRNCEENAFDSVPNVGFAAWFVYAFTTGHAPPFVTHTAAAKT